MKTVIGSVFAATFTSACCLGPVMFSMIGAGALGAAAVSLEPLRPLFAGVTAVLLGGAFYATYRTGPASACKADDTCNPRGVRTARALLWLATVVVILILTFPYYMRFFV